MKRSVSVMLLVAAVAIAGCRMGVPVYNATDVAYSPAVATASLSGALWMALAGVASILFGVLLVIFPAAGALSLVWLIAAFAFVFGIFQIALGWRLRGIHERADAVQ